MEQNPPAKKYQLSDYGYDLKDELIAQYPLKNRSDSKLLHFQKGQIYHRKMIDFPSLLNSDDILVINHSRVIKARLWAQKPTGAKIQILFERALSNHTFLAQCQSNKPIKTNQTLFLLTPKFELSKTTIIAKDKNEGFYCFETKMDIDDLIDCFGHIPLPPYIKRNDEAIDFDRYQTVYAKSGKSVACPTAGLHFDNWLIEQIKQKKVQIVEICLNVGSGTFKPVKSENINHHQMHNEDYEISELSADIINRSLNKKQNNQNKSRIIAIGSTSTRVLESNFLRYGKIKKGKFSTNLFIKPNFEFQVVDAMLTNFHTPYSTLVIMVASFMGYKNWQNCYDEAIDNQYRFLSYGDGMFIEAK